MKRLLVVLSLILTLITNQVEAAVPLKLAAKGPGSRIHGMDISHWQHPGGAPIDFKKMYHAGIRFVMIKGADTQDPADALAVKYLKIDRPAAQAVGIYTGFYYYATLPDTTDTLEIQVDAFAQAQKAIWRLSSIGGYTTRDLPISLDLEDNCVRHDSSGTCLKYMNPKYVTLWATTWLKEVTSKTGRIPFIYSYQTFLQNAMVRSAELANYPLWIAQYNIDPATHASQLGANVSGCYAHSWTNNDCTMNWQFWQYTSCGIASKYGVPGTRVDLNVFSGDTNAFYALTAGVWAPQATQMLPVNEPTSINIISTTVTTKDPVQFTVDVLRPNGTPVVTGTVDFKSLDSTLTNGVQKVVRSASGRYTLSISKLTKTHYLGLIEFIDATGTHAPSSTPVQFDVLRGPSPTPIPTPGSSTTASPSPTNSPSPSATVTSTASPSQSPMPTVKPKPSTSATTSNYCAAQIRN